jgi:hypothetical protein
LIKRLSFYQSSRKSTKNPRKTLKIPLKIRGEKKEKGKNMGKNFVNRPYCEGSRS